MKIIDRNEFKEGVAVVKSVRLYPAEFEAIELYRQQRWNRDKTNLTWGAALREIISAYDWNQVNEDLEDFLKKSLNNKNK